MSLINDDTKHIILNTDPLEYDSPHGIAMNTTWSVNTLYEYESKS